MEETFQMKDSAYLANTIVFFDTHDSWLNLLPLVFTRPTSKLRVGITTILEKWSGYADKVAYQVAPYLQWAHDLPAASYEDNSVYIAGNILPTEDLVEAIKNLGENTRLISGETLIAFRGTPAQWLERESSPAVEFPEEKLDIIVHIYDMFLRNAEWIKKDFMRLTSGMKSKGKLISCNIIGDNSLLFLEEGAEAVGATFNTSEGPIYLGKNARVMEGACLRGPVAIGDNSQVNMLARIYPGTTLGAWCKVGGELKNVIIQGYTNKSHDGFLGNAVIGKWCNIGAGCSASNLKNDYSPVKVWNYRTQHFEKTGLQFCGLIMGDHSKAGINTMFNTGTVVGVGCNIHGSGFPRNFIPSFSDGGASGFVDVSLPKFFETASRVMARRGLTLTEVDQRLFDHIFDYSKKFK